MNRRRCQSWVFSGLSVEVRKRPVSISRARETGQHRIVATQRLDGKPACCRNRPWCVHPPRWSTEEVHHGGTEARRRPEWERDIPEAIPRAATIHCSDGFFRESPPTRTHFRVSYTRGLAESSASPLLRDLGTTHPRFVCIVRKFRRVSTLDLPPERLASQLYSEGVPGDSPGSRPQGAHPGFQAVRCPNPEGVAPRWQVRLAPSVVHLRGTFHGGTSTQGARPKRRDPGLSPATPSGSGRIGFLTDD